MAKILTNMITNFAKTGDPSTTRFKWPPFGGNKSTEHVSINLPPKIIQGELHWPHPKFWNVEAELISRHAARPSRSREAERVSTSVVGVMVAGGSASDRSLGYRHIMRSSQRPAVPETSPTITSSSRDDPLS
ncbi:hypothetical protein OSTOST_23494 [Ostertagia ostertagi]